MDLLVKGSRPTSARSRSRFNPITVRILLFWIHAKSFICTLRFVVHVRADESLLSMSVTVISYILVQFSKAVG